MVNTSSQEIRDRILGRIEEFPQFPDTFSALLSVKEEDLSKIASFLTSDPEPTVLQLHQFFSSLLNYLPSGAYINPWLAIYGIWLLSSQESNEPSEILEILGARFAPNHNLKPLKNFFLELRYAQERWEISTKASYIRSRNTRLLNSAVTACDLRAIFKEDFSPAVTEASYNPALDFERFTPVAKVRLNFDAAGTDYFDFACDINILELLIHSLNMTMKQLKALEKIASKLESED